MKKMYKVVRMSFDLLVSAEITEKQLEFTFLACDEEVASGYQEYYGGSIEESHPFEFDEPYPEEMPQGKEGDEYIAKWEERYEEALCDGTIKFG